MVSGLVKVISTGRNSFQRPHIDVQVEEREFQASVPCAILINWNITPPKMVRNNVLEK